MSNLLLRRRMMMSRNAGSGIMIDGVLITDVYEELYVPTAVASHATITIQHNLGKVPKLVIAMPEGNIAGRSGCLYSFMALFNPSVYPAGCNVPPEVYYSVMNCNNGNISPVSYELSLTADSSEVTINTGYSYVHPNIQLRFFVYA